MGNYVKDVLDFLAGHTGFKKDKFDFDTALSLDLNLSKSESKELIKDFSKEFNVDIKKLNFNQYEFPIKQKESFLTKVSNAILFWKKGKKNKKAQNSSKKLITVSMLINSAQKGHWIDS